MKSGGEPDVPPTVDEVVRGLYRLFQSVDYFSRKSLRELGVSGPQVWALRTIRDAECTTESELARRIHLPPGTVSGLIDRLEAHGSAARRAAHEGDRVVELRLTSSGRQIVSRAPEPPQSRIARGVEVLPTGDLACLHRAVAILARLVETEGPMNDALRTSDPG